MFNFLKNNIYSYLYCDYVKNKYEHIYKIENKEDVYYSQESKKIVITIQDKERGKAIYDIIKFLNSIGKDIHCHNIAFTFKDYATDNSESIKWFSLEGKINFSFRNLSTIEKLQEIIAFIDFMQNEGFVLDESKFDPNNKYCVSEFLECFVPGNTSDAVIKSIVKFVHYILYDGEELEKFYSSKFCDNVIFHVHRFSGLYKYPTYYIPVIGMCFNLFKYGTVPSSIYEIRETLARCQKFKEEKIESYMIALSKQFCDYYKETKETNEYIIYDDSIKIYKHVDQDQEYNKLLKDSNFVLAFNDIVLEQINEVIMDCYGRVIGYRFTEKRKDITKILDCSFNTQKDIFTFMQKLMSFVKIRDSLRFLCGRGYEFNIQKSIVMVNGEFKIPTYDDLYFFIRLEKYVLGEKITLIFFKLLQRYIYKRYGEEKIPPYLYEKGLLKLPEVKYLNPLLARNFICFMCNENVDYEEATEAFFKFTTDMRSDSEYCYEPRLEYAPGEVDIVFKDEVEQEYNIKIEKNTEITLPDGRMMVIFKRSNNNAGLKDKEENIDKDILNKLGGIANNGHVNIIKIQKVIYSTKLNSNDMYSLIGYITEPIYGSLMTKEAMLKLSNKDLYKVIGYLFINFSDYYIPTEYIFMDSNFMFYINIWDKEFKIKKSEKDISSFYEFVKWQFAVLCNSGYNTFGLDDLLYKCIEKNRMYGKIYEKSKVMFSCDIINFSESLDSFCNEHKLYYNRKDMFCPICKKTMYAIPRKFCKKREVVFEDLYATHYKIDDYHNLKVYKSSCDLEKIKQIVGKRVEAREKGTIFDMNQSCFVPCKKALYEDSKEFIGYVYESVEFNDCGNRDGACIYLKDIQKLKSKPKLKSLQRLILQVKEMTDEGLGFIENPFSYVFLSSSLKKQVQILNIEFLCSNKKMIKQTHKWLLEYVKQSLDSDDSIMIDTSDFPDDIDICYEKLEEISKYCSIHKILYNKKHVFCPKCFDKNLSNIKFIKEGKSKYDETTPDNEGGEARIYVYGENSVVKVFKNDALINFDLKYATIIKIISKTHILNELNSQGKKYKYIYPQSLVIDPLNNSVYGYLMHNVKEAFPISSLKDKKVIEKLSFSLKDVLEILITIGEGIEQLHTKANIFIGDLNGRNILFDAQKNVYFIDFDGMGVDEITPEYCTDGYIDPVSKKNKNITMKDDWYSFAIQAFYYLTYTHPFNGIYEIKEDERKRLLDIPEKMEKKISLLGNHGLKPPAIAEPWDWMNSELTTAFLNIFEGSRRESIVPYLKEQYKILFSDNQPINNILRINSKFVAKELNLFYGKVHWLITHYAAICKIDEEFYLSVLVGEDEIKVQKNIHLDDYEGIINVLLTENEKIVFVVYKDMIIAKDLRSDAILYKEEIQNTKNIIVNENRLYYVGTYKGANVIFMVSISTDGSIETEKYDIGKQPIECFDVRNYDKFVLVKRTEDDDKIYCNTEELCNIAYTSNDSKYNIIYDKENRSWLVINSEGNGIVIDKKGTYKRVDLSEYTNDTINIYFKKGNIYVPGQNCLNIINVNDQSTAKKMECNKIMTPDSMLYDITPKSFGVATNNVLYKVYKG